jgi:acylphosphatase
VSPDIIRQRVVFRGRVQGVGFRYTTASIARRYPVVGFVRNLPDGSVELIAEADRLVLEQFLADIATEFAGHIRKQDVSEVPRDEPFDAFEIRR